LGTQLEIWIDRAERNWLEVLYLHAEQQFRGCSLPSHDHSHHLRVWNLCKVLLREISALNSNIDQALVEGVLIAAFFHDLGMVRSLSEEHGRLGSDLCRNWFRDQELDPPGNFPEILRAIELHDRKGEPVYGPFRPEVPPEILGILTVADDLEALGTIGIYRYAEIYLQRGLPLEELGSRVLANAKSRFEMFRESCRLCPALIRKYLPQYEELNSFYMEYNLQLQSVSEPGEVRSGPLGVINYIRRPEAGQGDGIPEALMDYFKILEHELDQERM
jgi:hypothetical protein